MKPRSPYALAVAAFLALGLAPAATAQDDAELPELRPIIEELAQLRGLDFDGDVPAEAQSLEDWGKYIDGALEEFFPVERRDGMQRGLQRLGLLLEPIDLGGEFKQALLSQAGGYYDPQKKKFFYLMTDMPKDLIRTIAAHELVHALQDQHFDLAAFLDGLAELAVGEVRHDDRSLAAGCLVEGEAQYVATHWQMADQMGMDLSASAGMERMTFKTMAEMELDSFVKMTAAQLPALGIAKDSTLGKAMLGVGEIPPYVIEPLMRQYLVGPYFVMQVKAAKGWKGVDAAYKELPQSTEQVLHPEKYLAERDDPTPIDMPRSKALLEAGWKPLDAAVHGELYLGILLRNHGVKNRVARRAVAGWDGDMYRAYGGPDGQTLIVLATTWDTTQDSQEFFDAYKTALRSKYPQAKLHASDDTDRVGFDCRDEQLGHGAVVRRLTEVFAVEGGTPELARAVLAELGALEIEFAR